MKLRGTGVALVTPFAPDKSIDTQGLENLVNHCIEGGVEYLVVLGTTAESATLSFDEKLTVISTIKKANRGRVPMVLGIGGNNTVQVAADFERFPLDGFDAILSVSPYYNKPTQEGIYQHFKYLAERAPLPIVLYNVPGRTASNMSAHTTLRLAKEFKNIIAIKEASGNLEQVMEIIENRPEGFLVISGDDNLTFPMVALGGDGVISVSGQAFPKIFTQMVRDALAGKMEPARKGHYQLFDVTKMLFEEGNPGGVKVTLKAQGICGDDLRQPLWPVSDGLKQRLQTAVDKM